MNMKKNLFISICTLFALFSSAQNQISHNNLPSTREDKTGYVKSFYKEYITYLYTDEHKKDSLITNYCSADLKEIVQSTLEKDDYNFLLDGWGGSDIDPNSVEVNNLGKGKYNVLFKVYHHFGDDTVSVNIWVIVSDDRGANAKIEQVIRQSDNYAVPATFEK
jgi:hypothetical protein